MENKPKILFLDIENTPLISYTWGIWEQDVIEVKEEWYLLSCAYKWLGEKETHVVSLPDFRPYKRDKKDDFGLIVFIRQLLDEADIVVAHNGNAHDIKKIFSRILQHGLTPPSPFKQVDTLLVARKYFKFDSNKLDRLGQYLNVGRKIKNEGFSLWLGCMSGDKNSWKKMVKYNKQDVVLLEKVYKKLLPYISNHPNWSFWGNTGHKCCPNCGSKHYHLKSKEPRLKYIVQRLQCADCGKYFYGDRIKK